MAGRLRSISSRIHWSLVLKAAVFAVAWAWLPYWIFFFIAFALYLFPLPEARRLAVPFGALMLLTYLQPGSGIFTVIYGLLFYAILLIKGLFLVDRKSAYELLVLMLSFLFLRGFYMRFNEGVTVAGVWYSLALALIIAMLARSFIRSFRDDVVMQQGAVRAASFLFSTLFFQIILAGLFLPVDFVHQSIAAFLAIVLLVDLIPEHLFGSLTPNKIFTAFATVFALLVIVLNTSRWGL